MNFKTGKGVTWEAIGTSGFTVGKVHEHLVDEINKRMPDPDILVIMLGGNDTFELNSPLRWRKDMKKLVNRVRDEHPETQIVIANLPPVGDFTSFSQLLQWYLGSLTNMYRKVIMDFPKLYSNLIYMSEKIDFDKWRKEEERDVRMKEFFSDGVHPSALMYRLWGRQIAARVLGE